MCGIAGLITKHQISNLDQRKLKRMLRLMKHRGPDSEGIFQDQKILMGMKRLAIVDVTGGDQPFISEDGQISVIGNGEIYNYPQLLKLVDQKKHQLSSKSDIEIILHLYQDRGVKAFELLNGMFAIALYDKSKQQFFLVRDRNGEKPLYYAQTKEAIIFTSELKAIAKASQIKLDLDHDSLVDYFHYYYVPEPKTIFTQIKKLPPGFYLQIDLNKFKLKINSYVKTKTVSLIKKKLLKTKIATALKKACSRAMMADVRVGLALSGGLDSAAILSCLTKKERQNLTAVTVGYQDTPLVDERAMAQKIATHFQIPAISSEIKTNQVVADFSQIVLAQDEPIADIAAISLFYLTQFAKKNKLKVLLTGAGGDELFWGYAWIRNLAANGLKKEQIFGDDQPAFRKAKQFLSLFYTTKFSQISDNHRFQAKLTNSRQTKTNHVRHCFDLMRQMWLIPDVLTLSDRLGMANSVEVRSPLVDFKLVNLLRSQPSSLFAFRLEHKYWLKRSLKFLLPQFILKRKKQGFTPPVVKWLWQIIGQYVVYLDEGELVKQQVLSKWKIKFLRYFWWTMPLWWYQIYQLLVLEILLRDYYRSKLT